MRVFSISMVGLLTCLQLFAAHTGKDTARLDLQAFAGTWKEDPNSIQIPMGAVLRFEKGPDGVLQRIIGHDGKPTPVRIDGKDYAVDDSSGRTVAWTKAEENTYVLTAKRNGQVTGGTRSILSGRGERLTLDIYVRRNGVDEPLLMDVYERASGSGQTLEGTWKMTARQKKMLSMMIIKVSGDALEVSHSADPAIGMVAAKADGKEYPVRPEFTIKYEPAGARELRVTLLKDHLPYVQQTWKLSEDERTLTSTSKPATGTLQTAVTVYRRI